MSPPVRPLDGIVVVALEQAVAAPLATCRLADAGARVIKLERTDGDFARGYDDVANGQSAYFAWLNRGKESLAIDIKSDADQALLHRLLARADVFVQNLAVGAAARSGFDSADLRERYPRLITCDISGYGQAGPYAEMKAYDLLVQAESALVSISGPPGEYGRCGVSICDISTGLSAALAINEALALRSKTGCGSAIELSLFDVMAEMMAVPLLHHDYADNAPERVGLAHPSITPYGGFVTRDGVTLVISIQNEREWRSLLANVIDRADLVDDPRYANNRERMARREEVDGLVEDAFAKHDRADLEVLLRNARIAYGAVNDMAGLSAHPQLRRHEVESPTGPVTVPAHPDAARRLPPTAIPAIDQHGATIRAEFDTDP